MLFRSRPLPGNYTKDKFSTVDSVKRLGIIIDHRLTLGQPIDFVTLKLATNVFLRSLIQINDVRTALHIFS